MTVIAYAPDESVRAARARYFDVNHFGTNGGYEDAWVDFKFGPIPMPIPNTPARIRAVRFHDLHHIVTGYDTDLIGELEISAWELGAGCRDFVAAWGLNLGGAAAGAFLAPLRTLRALARGRRSSTVYGDVDVESLLDQDVASLRASTHVPQGDVAITLADVAIFAFYALVGLSIWGALFVPGIVFGPILAFFLGRAKARASVSA